MTAKKVRAFIEVSEIEDVQKLTPNGGTLVFVAGHIMHTDQYLKFTEYVASLDAFFIGYNETQVVFCKKRLRNSTDQEIQKFHEQIKKNQSVEATNAAQKENQDKKLKEITPTGNLFVQIKMAEFKK